MLEACKLDACKHNYVDIYGGSGLSRYSDNITLVTVFCKRCLDVQVITYSNIDFKQPKNVDLDVDTDIDTDTDSNIYFAD